MRVAVDDTAALEVALGEIDARHVHQPFIGGGVRVVQVAQGPRPAAVYVRCPGNTNCRRIDRCTRRPAFLLLSAQGYDRVAASL